MAELFTRGGTNAPDQRGEALMQRHTDKLQRAKEDAALKAMRRLLPNLSPAVWVLALEECDWDVEEATVLMNTFQAAKRPQLALIQQALEALSRPAVEAASESDSGNDKEGRKRKHRNKEVKKKRKKPKHEKKPKEKRPKEKRRRSVEGPQTMRKQFGKYGIIGESDLGSKYTEFALWASEVMKIDLEVLPKNEEKEFFKTFCEDFNTATLPHKKYYNLEEYQQQKAARAARHASTDDDEPMALNDEEDLRRQQAAERAAAQQERLRDAYLELKHRAPGKAEDMREQELLRSQMALAYRTGDREKAAQIAERLKPDEVKEREAARRLDPENPLQP